MSPPCSRVLFSIMLCVLVSGLLGQAPARASVSGPALTHAAESGEVDQWRRDIELLRDSVVQLHPSDCGKLGCDKWQGAIEELLQRLPDLHEQQTVTSIMQLLARLGDGHTAVPPFVQEKWMRWRLPIAVELFDGGELRIIAASPSHRSLIGMRIDRIGTVTTPVALERVRSVISADNSFGRDGLVPTYIVVSDVLAGLGVAEKGSSALRLELSGDAGTQSALLSFIPTPTVAGHRPPPTPSGWAALGEQVQAGSPHARPYASSYNGKSRLYRIDYSAAENFKSDSMPRFAARVREEIKRLRPEKTIVDLRKNQGGNGWWNRPLLKALLGSDWLAPDDRLFVAIGPRTFSAGVMMALELEKYANATFVGRPTGGSVMSWGDHEPVTLPNSGLKVMISTQFYQNNGPNDAREGLHPEIVTPFVFADFAAGRDPVLRAVTSDATTPPADVVDCRSVDVLEDMALFKDERGRRYSLFSGRHGERRFQLFTAFDDGWRGPLAFAGATGRMNGAGAPIVELKCRGDELSALRVSIGREETLAHRVRLETEEIRFRSGPVTLSGTVVLPAGGGPVPGVVFVHGSGPSTRHDFREFALISAEAGFASLIYDKRGAGESGGRWQTAKFGDLSDDAVAALAALRNHSRTKGDGVGMFGASQGAWVGAIAAAKAPAAFFIASGGGPVSPLAQEYYRRLRLASEEHDLGEEEDLARKTLDLWFAYLLQPQRYETEVRKHWGSVDFASKPWRQSLGIPSKDPTEGSWPEERRRFADELDFDPLPFYRMLACPVLGILGLDDQAFPVPHLLEAFNSLEATRDVTVIAIPAADHGWFVKAGDRRFQSPEAFRMWQAWMKSAAARGARCSSA